MSHRAWASTIVVGLFVAGCAGSDGAPDSDSGAVSEIGSAGDDGGESGDEGDVFSDGGSQIEESSGADGDGDGDGDGGVAADAPTSTGSAAPDAGSDPAASTTTPTSTESTPSSADDDVASDPDPESDPETGPGVDPDEGDDGDPGADPDPDPDPVDREGGVDLDDVLPLDEIDDDPFCESYARMFESFLAITLQAAFGQAVSDDPDALVALPEIYEVIVYPGLVEDVETIRDDGDAEIVELLGPLLDRVVAAPGLLRDAGLGDDEIVELTAAVRVRDLEAIDVDDLDPRVGDAAQALLAEFGPFFDASDALAVSAEQEAAFEARCPLLAATLNEA